jgi:acyl-CoA synthetase (NDP forming)
MLGVFEHAGFGVRRLGSGGEVTVSLDIRPDELVQDRIGERDHLGAVAALRSVLSPSSIAVLGAARSDDIAAAVMANIEASGFEGEVLHVDRGSLMDLAINPELVIAAAGGEELLELATEAASSGARALLVLPAGGEEDGAMSPEQERRLLETLRESGLRMIGPGSLGVINSAPRVRLNATYSSADVRPGRLAIGSHAVAPGLGLLDHVAARQLGVSAFVSLGSRADVSTSDLLEWCGEDTRTGAVMLYVESFGDPRRFTRVAQRVSREKPILVMHGSDRARHTDRENQSQTAISVLGDEMFEAVLQHAGVLRFASAQEMLEAAELFESQPLTRGPQIGILSNSPAVARLGANACTSRALSVRGPENPLVLGPGAGPREYGAGIRRLLADPSVDALMVCYVDHPGGSGRAIMEAAAAACHERSKPAVACIVGADGGRVSSSAGSVPNFVFPESCAAALARAAERRAWLSRPLGERPSYVDIDTAAARALIDAILKQPPAGGWLEPEDLEVLLTTHGIRPAGTHRCGDVGRALAAAKAIGGPVALKADLGPPARASDIQAVLVGLQGHAAIRAGWRELQRRVEAAGHRWRGAIVQSLAGAGADILVGALSDPDLGTVLAVGLGGRRAGAGKATAFRPPPATDVEADELIDACEPAASELESFPGDTPLDRGALRELILRFALLVQTAPEITEADLNTIRCTTHGCAILDARMRIEPRRPIENIKTW